MKKIILILLTVFTIPLYSQNYLEKQKTINAGMFYDIVSLAGGKIFTARSGDIFMSVNSGANWSRFKTFDFGSVRALSKKNSTLYAGLSSGGIWWTNNSIDWEYNQIRSNPVSGQPASVAVLGIDNAGTIFINAVEYGFLKSDNGTNWTQLATPPGFTVMMSSAYQFAFNELNNVFVATSDGVFKSTNAGDSWESVNNGLKGITTGIVYTSNALYCSTTEGAFKSTNNGSLWFSINEGITDFNLSEIFAAPQGKLYAGSFSGKIFISSDEGNRWEICEAQTYGDVITGFCTEGNKVLVCTQGAGIFRSDDGVTSWLPSSREIGPEYLSCFIKYDGNKYAVSSAGMGVLFSEDGINWSKRNTGLPSGVSITKILRIPSGKIFATTFLGDLYFTTNNGLQWTLAQSGGLQPSDKITNIFLSENGMLTISANQKSGYPFPQRYARIYTSMNGGESWLMKLNKSLSETKLMSVSKQGTMYIALTTNFALRDTIFRSTNLGDSWEKVTVNGAVNSPATIKINSNNEEVFVITKNDNKIFYLSNGGASWMPLTSMNFPSTTVVTCMEFNSANKIFAATNNSGIYTSSTGGQSWQTLTNGLYGHITTGSGFSYAYISSLLIDENDYLHLTTYEDGLYKSLLPTSVVSTVSNSPGKFYLQQNYPNPFNPTTKIKFDLPKSTFVKINVFDISGKLVNEIINQNLYAGSYEAEFNGANLASGIYYYRIEANDFIETKKMMLIK